MNSPGGSAYAGLAIYDTMQYIKPDVSTICVGMAMSMAAILLCGGAKGQGPSNPCRLPESIQAIVFASQSTKRISKTNPAVKPSDPPSESGRPVGCGQISGP